MDTQQDAVLRAIEDRDVRFIRLWFTDVAGTLKSVTVAPAEVEGAFEEGIGFDGSSIEGFARTNEADMLVRPDASTFQVLPWAAEDGATARMFCDIITPDGQRAAVDPRDVLRRTLAKAEDKGFTFYAHPEVEFYLFESEEIDPNGPRPVDTGGYFDNVPGSIGHDVRRSAVSALEDLGISVEYSHHEGGPGQQEIDLRFADARTMADNIMTLRAVVKEAAMAQGVYATFMPKPLWGHPGSGMHTHLSLFEGETNTFYEPAAKYQLSNIGRRFVAGLLKHAPEIAAVTNQFVNSYKRLWGGDEAPSFVSWGHANHSALVRVPRYKPNKSASARIEYRGLDSAANPYLAYALLLAAGMKGIEEEHELPAEAEDDVLEMSDMERSVMGFTPMPASLAHAIQLMEESELVAETLGEQVYSFVLANKRKEWKAYRGQVTPFELATGMSL